MRRVLLTLGIAGVCSACNESLDGIACDDVGYYALNVAVSDSASGALITTDSIVAKATEGAYVDSMRIVGASRTIEFPLSLAVERAGTYRVSVAARGYAPWVRDGVRVDRDLCHVIPVSVAARLRRL
jgi:hypothetical protein